MKKKRLVNLLDNWQFPRKKRHLKNAISPLIKYLKAEDGVEVLTKLSRSKGRVKAHIVSKSEALYYSGNEILPLILKGFCKDKFKLKTLVQDGELVNKGDLLLLIECSLRDLYIFERPILNILMFTCGLTTKTKKLTQLLKVSVLDTRKTLPWMRGIAKYASFVGGAINHRWNFEDMIMVKDTHRLSYGNDLNALLVDIKKLKAKKPICVEVESLEDLRIALKHQVDWIMLDNVKDKLDSFFEVIRISEYRPIIEISGNIEADFSYVSDIPYYVSSSQVSYLPEKVDLSLKVVT